MKCGQISTSTHSEFHSHIDPSNRTQGRAEQKELSPGERWQGASARRTLTLPGVEKAGVLTTVAAS